ncbi:MAG: glycosyl hydrolase [Ginsengibacter sp.]
MRLIKKNVIIFGVLFIIALCSFLSYNKKNVSSEHSERSEIVALKAGFLNPPDSARPGVYWYFMDGNLSKEGMKEDLISMKKAGIGRVIFLEVNVGIPRGPVDFLSDQWYELFKYAENEAERLGIEMTLGVGPGWAGSGGPWVTPEQSMQQLVSSSTYVSGPGNVRIKLSLPINREPYFGERTLTPSLKKQREDFYKEVAVLAFPTPEIDRKIEDVNEMALYYRAPFSSVTGVKPFLLSVSDSDSLPESALISKNQIINLTNKMQPDGTLDWTVPAGNWTIMRFVSRNNGALTRPAPVQGLGFECDKLDTAAVNMQLAAYVGKILHKIGKLNTKSSGGLKTLHLDSWEMGAQNWTPQFRKEFMKRRGYDPLPFYPVYAGNIVEGKGISERFLWDIRQTCNELVVDNYAGQLKRYAHRHGLNLSIEPYDMNPSADLELGSVADIPMGEFWSKGFGYNTSFSCIEATSIAHIGGKPIVQGEAFTASREEAWKQYPGSMKDQGDWAFATGINRFYYHTFEHKYLNDSLRPGMTMGPYGVHWDRKQTWWPMVAEYHRYISRCQFILQQGKSVADILYLTPEGAPQVFLPPPSALKGNDTIPDRRGYNFDGCSPSQLYKASVKDKQIVFPGGATYRLLVLPSVETMTPALLEKIRSLVYEGVTVVGMPPIKSPSLSGFPECDKKVQSLSREIWGDVKSPAIQTEHNYGKGMVVWGGNIGIMKGNNIYPDYALTAELLSKKGVAKDFESSGPVRYTHRTKKDWDIYFVSNSTDKFINTECQFRTTKGMPELWDPLTGKTRTLPAYKVNKGITTVPLQFESYQSFFIVFSNSKQETSSQKENFPSKQKLATLDGPWFVSFDPKWGGPAKITFDHLIDWTLRPEEGIKYYSGIAVYKKSFDLPKGVHAGKSKQLYLDLGETNNMAHVTLNGHDLGVVWTAPWRVDITDAVKLRGNQLKIEVANLWPNRLIGDQQLPEDGIKNKQWPEWFVKGEKRTSGRFTFTTYNPYKKGSVLFTSGLIGPVTIEQVEF